jgi:hypothetical protein
VNGKDAEDSKGDSEDSKGDSEDSKGDSSSEQENIVGVFVPKSP